MEKYKNNNKKEQAITTLQSGNIFYTPLLSHFLPFTTSCHSSIFKNISFLLRHSTSSQPLSL